MGFDLMKAIHWIDEFALKKSLQWHIEIAHSASLGVCSLPTGKLCQSNGGNKFSSEIQYKNCWYRRRKRMWKTMDEKLNVALKIAQQE